MHEAVIVVAKYFIVLVGLIALYVFLRLDLDGKKRFVVQGIIGGIIALILAKIGGHLWNDPRPFVSGHVTPYFSHPADNGFPSDHTLLASFLGWLTLYYRKSWGWTILAIAALIGAARVIAHVHHVADIIGAFVIAAIGAVIAGWIANKIIKNKRTTKKTKDTSE